MHAKSLQSCPTLCDPMDSSLPGSSVHGILKARILEWVAISFSNVQFSSVEFSHSVVSDSLRPHELQPTRLLCLWDPPGKNTGMGCHFLLQGIFLTQRSNAHLLHCRQILYHLPNGKYAQFKLYNCELITVFVVSLCMKTFLQMKYVKSHYKSA